MNSSTIMISKRINVLLLESIKLPSRLSVSNIVKGRVVTAITMLPMLGMFGIGLADRDKRGAPKCAAWPPLNHAGIIVRVGGSCKRIAGSNAQVEFTADIDKAAISENTELHSPDLAMLDRL